jgi:hydroxypyruvate isomerase
MLRFSANLGMMFEESPFIERFAQASAAGFGGVEYPVPYTHPPAELAEQLRAHGLEQVLFNLPCGDFAKGERGIACQPARRGEFSDGVGQAIEYARALGCTRVNCLAGPAPESGDAVAFDTLVDNLRFAAAALAEAGVRLMIEPINGRDMPGFYLQTSAQALRVMDAVASDNLLLQYDVYHMQVMEGDLARHIERYLPSIGHIQIADNPGRHEPGSGEINYAFLLPHIDRLGYTGWVGCEYRPAAGTQQGLGWLSPFRR